MCSGDLNAADLRTTLNEIRHFLNTFDWQKSDLQTLLDEARAFKASPYGSSLEGKTIALLFLNLSLIHI